MAGISIVSSKRTVNTSVPFEHTSPPTVPSPNEIRAPGAMLPTRWVRLACVISIVVPVSPRIGTRLRSFRPARSAMTNASPQLRMSATIPAMSSGLVCEQLMRKPSTPALISAAIVAFAREAGPMVATILVPIPAPWCVDMGMIVVPFPRTALRTRAPVHRRRAHLPRCGDAVQDARHCGLFAPLA